MSGTDEPAALSAAKRALLERRLRGEPDAGPPALPRRPPAAPPTLSRGQLRLWFLHQLAPDGNAYTMFDARRLRGPIDAEALRAAVRDVVDVHEILRTRYVTRDGRPEPVVAEPSAFAFEVVSVRSEPADLREARVAQTAAAFVRRPFDLEHGPVLRALLASVADDDHVFVLAIHHIACDEWSLATVWRDLAAAYGATRSGRTQPPARPTVQYADFAYWQEARRRSGSSADAHLAYWRRALAGCPPPLELPPDRVPPPRRSFAGGTATARLGDSAAGRLAEIARAAGTTRFVLHLAAFLALLHRYTGETDLVVGVPATGRDHSALESAVGFFLNTLALRVDVAGDPSWRTLLGRTHAAFLDAASHRDTPFEAVVDAVAPERRLSRNPLFSVMLVEQSQPAVVSFGEPIAVTPYALEGGGAKFDLTLFTGERAGGVDLMIEYDADRFERATAERMLRQYGTLLNSIAEDPDRPISALRLMSSSEQRLVQSWSRGPALLSAAAVHERFAAHAQAAPDRIAAIDARGSLTYAQLLRRADGIAALVRAHGLAAGERVGVCAGRSADLIAAILGVLRAGGAYVPLDPDYPPAHLDFAMRDAGVRLVLASTAHAARVSSPSRNVLTLDGGEAGAAGAHAATPVEPGSAAYVIHTSGSTGEPKGVLVSHRNLAHSTAARDIVYPEPPRVFLLLSSFAFDSSVAGIFWTLAAGGVLALPPRRIEQDVHALAEFIRRHGVTHTLCLPSLWATILEHAPAAALRSLRTVIVAGEACPTGLVRRHYDALPDAALWNEYGPTEATVWSTAYRIPRGFDGARVPIGRPVAGAHVHVLGTDGQPAPIGVPGELWIGGAGVAASLGGEEGERPRFVADPFSTEPGARLYRTGDVARWRDDGLLEFMGRTDQQVKVRGHRIEPAEIEAALRRHTGVRDVVVGVRTASSQAAGVAPERDRLVAALRALEPAEAERLLALAEAVPGLEASA